MFDDQSIILASGSPRRQQLLRQAEIAFSLCPSSVKEDFPASMAPEEVPVFLAEKKAAAVAAGQPSTSLILAADTAVLLGDQVLGKPADRSKAVAMLNDLSGHTHRVITGICLQKGRRRRSFSVMTRVTFRKLSPFQIAHYVDHYAPFDKAGAYGIQEWIGLVGIESIEGDYFNVVGLPVARVVEAISNWVD